MKGKYIINSIQVNMQQLYPAELATEATTSSTSSIITIQSLTNIPVYSGPEYSPMPVIIRGSAQEPTPAYEEEVDPKCDPPLYDSLFDIKQSTMENS